MNKDQDGSKEEREKDLAFYQEIWDERPHYCYETGQWLGNEPLTVFFHHLLEKEMYPELRYEKENVVLVSWRTHDQIGLFGLSLTPKVKALTEEVKLKFKK